MELIRGAAAPAPRCSRIRQMQAGAVTPGRCCHMQVLLHEVLLHHACAIAPGAVALEIQTTRINIWCKVKIRQDFSHVLGIRGIVCCYLGDLVVR